MTSLWPRPARLSPKGLGHCFLDREGGMNQPPTTTPAGAPPAMRIISLRHRHTNIARGMLLAGTATHVSALRGRSSEVIRVRSLGGVHRTQPTHGFPL